jgi:hypothetical protein
MSIALQLSKYSSLGPTGGTIVNRKLLIGAFIIALASFFVGCSTTSDQANANQTITTTGPDNSEIVTTTDSTGTRTETRTFRDNPRVSRVVVTTRDGRRTVKAYSKTGEERDVPEAVGDALVVTGDKIADAAGWVADKTTTGVNEVGDKLEDVGDKAKSGVKEVGDKAEDVGDKAASTAKTVGRKTVSGAKKTGRTIKKVVTP